MHLYSYIDDIHVVLFYLLCRTLCSLTRRQCVILFRGPICRLDWETELGFCACQGRATTLCTTVVIAICSSACVFGKLKQKYSLSFTPIHLFAQNNIYRENLVRLLLGKHSAPLLCKNIFAVFVQLLFSCQSLRGKLPTFASNNDKLLLHMFSLAQVSFVLVCYIFISKANIYSNIECAIPVSSSL